ncbi:Histone acetyltransferase [Phytophthora palmivora]|uniref:histone acetyltransferase n=1 Tax=Phytophthora palmivora TaxID=4796 RepID=A0A2P4XVL4_9STRA|nr:Histone acetyltransferase [Phytophthora palmivora]
MDSSHAFVGDFGMNMSGSDNRFMNQFNLGGNVNNNSGMDLSGGLDFSSGMNLMTDSSMMLGGSSSSSTAGLIDFPDELNSPTTSSSGPSSSLMMDTSSSATMTSTTDAIPFPASLASESLTSSTSASSSGSLDVMNFMNTTTTSSGMNNNGMGLDMNMGLNMGMNMGMSMGMNSMGMDMSGSNFGMNDANQMMFNNMQHMNMMNPQGNYYMPQQQMQQQHYMQMMQQQRQLNLQRQQQQQKALLERQRLAQQQAQKNNQQTQQQQQVVQKQQMLTGGQGPSQMAAQRQMSGSNPNTNTTANANAPHSQSQASSQNVGPAATTVRPTWQSSADQALRAGTTNANGSAMGSGPQAANSPASAARNKSAQIIWQFKAKAQQVTSALDKNQTTEYHNKLRLMVREDVKTAGSKEVLQRQQQRLLLLRHAMWCKSPEGLCTTTPSCGEMKRLWAHMGACRQTNACSYGHCISSKYVLSHFQQCINAKCLVCQVVRYPVEVKEKNGALMLDADRALQQIIAASQRRQRMLAMKKQQDMQQQQQMQPQQGQQPQQPMPLAMPAHLQQPQNSSNIAAMNFQQQQQQNLGQGVNHATSVGTSMNSMGMTMPNGGNSSVSMQTSQSNTTAIGSNGLMGGGD